MQTTKQGQQQLQLLLLQQLLQPLQLLQQLKEVSIVHSVKIRQNNRYLHIIFLAFLNAGKECWGKCNRRNDSCEWCGTLGGCCKKNEIGNECNGKIGGDTGHRCVLIP